MMRAKLLVCVAFPMLVGCDAYNKYNEYDELKGQYEELQEKHAMIKEENEQLSKRIDKLEEQNANLREMAGDSEKLKSLFSTDS